MNGIKTGLGSRRVNTLSVRPQPLAEISGIVSAFPVVVG